MDNLRGIALMICAMAGFSLGDVGVKSLSSSMPLSQIVLAMGIFGTAVFATIARSAGQSLRPARFNHPAVIFRLCAEITAALFMVNALALSPLSLVTSVTQAGPLLVTIGAVLFFGETVGWRRWSAIFAGLFGVLIILRPGSEVFDIFALLSVAATLCLATRDLATRAAPKSLSNLQLAVIGFVGFNVAGLILMPFGGGWIIPNTSQWSYLALAVLPTLAGYYAITAAMRVGEIAVVTPFRYTRFLFGLGLGVFLFGERPDLWMLVGGALVVASGIYTVLRERRLAKGQG